MSRQLITDSNHSPLIEVFVWLLLALAVTGVCGREAIKLWVLRKIALDDAIILLTLAFSTAQSAAVLSAVYNGLGRHENDLSTDQLNRQQQARYAADILLVPSLLCAKAALLSIVRSLSPKKSHKRISWGIGAALVTWALISVFLTAFRCSLPQPWKETSNICINRVFNVMDFIASVNLITEIALVAYPCWIVQGLQMPIRNKLPIILTFLSRIVVIAAIICQMEFSHQVVGDTSFQLWQTVICTQIVQCLTILATCLVYLRPFLDSVESGFMRVDVARRRGQASTSASSTLNTSQESSGSKKPPVTGTWLDNAYSPAHELGEIRPHLMRTHVSYDRHARPDESGHDPRAITQTREYSVGYH